MSWESNLALLVPIPPACNLCQLTITLSHCLITSPSRPPPRCASHNIAIPTQLGEWTGFTDYFNGNENEFTGPLPTGKSHVVACGRTHAHDWTYDSHYGHMWPVGNLAPPRMDSDTPTRPLIHTSTRSHVHTLTSSHAHTHAHSYTPARARPTYFVRIFFPNLQ